MAIETRTPAKTLTSQEIRHFFISHLNRIYCAKSQLVEKLPELGKRAHFRDLEQAIGETVEMVNNQIARMRQIYILLDAWFTPESCIGLVGILDEAFQSIGDPNESPSLRDLSILFYMQNIESIEMTSFKIMLYAADKISEAGVTQLLQECYDEAKEDRVLFKAITNTYL